MNAVDCGLISLSRGGLRRDAGWIANKKTWQTKKTPRRRLKLPKRSSPKRKKISSDRGNKCPPRIHAGRFSFLPLIWRSRPSCYNQFMAKLNNNFLRGVWDIITDPDFLEILVFVIGILVTGTLFYHFVEGWRFLDSLYFSVTTLSTVGYGDLSPETDAGKLFTIFYIFIGVGTLLGFFKVIADHAKNKSTLDKFFSRRK
jgi:voltage-gated potassium channel